MTAFFAHFFALVYGIALPILFFQRKDVFSKIDRIYVFIPWIGICMATLFYFGIVPETNIDLKSWFISEEFGRLLYHYAMGIYILHMITFPFLVIYPSIKMMASLIKKRYISAIGMVLLIGALLEGVWIQWFHTYTSV